MRCPDFKLSGACGVVVLEGAVGQGWMEREKCVWQGVGWALLGVRVGATASRYLTLHDYTVILKADTRFQPSYCLLL